MAGTEPPQIIRLNLGGDYYHGEYIISSTSRWLYVQAREQGLIAISRVRDELLDVRRFVDNPLPHFRAIWTAVLLSGKFEAAEFSTHGILRLWAPKDSGWLPIEQIVTAQAQLHLPRPYGIELTSGPGSYTAQGPEPQF